LDENQNGYGILINQFNTYRGIYGRIQLYRVSNNGEGEHVVLGTYLPHSKVYDFSTWHKIKVELEGESIKVYLDDDNNACIEVSDSTYAPENAPENTGVEIGQDFWMGEGIPVWFDDIVLRGVHADDNFSVPPPQDPFRPVSGDWEIVDDGTGNYVYAQLDAGNWANAGEIRMSILDGIEVTEGTLETRFKIEETGFYFNNVYLYFGLDERNENGYAIVPNVFGGFLNNIDLYEFHSGYLGRWLGGRGRGSGPPVTLIPYNYEKGHTLKVGLDEDSIKVYVDDKIYFDYTGTADLDYGTGGVALGTSTKVYFDDIKYGKKTLFKDDLVPRFPCRFTPRGDGGTWDVVIDSDSDRGPVYHQSNNAADERHFMSLMDNVNFKTGSIETTFKMDSEDGGALLYFGLDDDNNGYAVCLKKNIPLYGMSDGVGIFEVTNGEIDWTWDNNRRMYQGCLKAVTLPWWMYSSNTYPPTFDALTLRVEIEKIEKGYRINVFLDNEGSDTGGVVLHAEVDDADYAGGRVALGTYETDAWFDNIKVIRDPKSSSANPYTTEDILPLPDNSSRGPAQQEAQEPEVERNSESVSITIPSLPTRNSNLLTDSKPNETKPKIRHALSHTLGSNDEFDNNLSKYFINHELTSKPPIDIAYSNPINQAPLELYKYVLPSEGDNKEGRMLANPSYVALESLLEQSRERKSLIEIIKESLVEALQKKEKDKTELGNIARQAAQRILSHSEHFNPETLKEFKDGIRFATIGHDMEILEKYISEMIKAFDGLLLDEGESFKEFIFDSEGICEDLGKLLEDLLSLNIEDIVVPGKYRSILNKIKSEKPRKIFKKMITINIIMEDLRKMDISKLSPDQQKLYKKIIKKENELRLIRDMYIAELRRIVHGFLDTVTSILKEAPPVLFKTTEEKSDMCLTPGRVPVI